MKPLHPHEFLEYFFVPGYPGAYLLGCFSRHVTIYSQQVRGLNLIDALCRTGQVLRMPIAHGEGNYYAAPDVLKSIEQNRQVVLRYTDGAGRIDDSANPNGSANGIASVCSEKRNVVGMMPHPERACEVLLGGTDGRVIFDSIIESFRAAERRTLQPAVGAS